MALKLRAPRLQGAVWLNDSSCPPGHDTTAFSRTSAPASFKRLLGGSPQEPCAGRTLARGALLRRRDRREPTIPAHRHGNVRDCHCNLWNRVQDVESLLHTARVWMRSDFDVVITICSVLVIVISHRAVDSLDNGRPLRR